jgi:hypothetical protein
MHATFFVVSSHRTSNTNTSFHFKSQVIIGPYTHMQGGKRSLCATGFQERLKQTTSQTNHSFAAFLQ